MRRVKGEVPQADAGRACSMSRVSTRDQLISGSDRRSATQVLLADTDRLRGDGIHLGIGHLAARQSFDHTSYPDADTAMARGVRRSSVSGHGNEGVTGHETSGHVAPERD